MATKKGAGGEPQEYDTSTGQYGGGNTFRQNTPHHVLMRIPLDFFAPDDVKELDNQAAREWYVDQVSKIHERIDPKLPIEKRARIAFEERNRIRTQARDMMKDQELRKQLDRDRPTLDFEQLVDSKMHRKNMTRAEAVQDVYVTAVSTNKIVNKRFGIGGKNV